VDHRELIERLAATPRVLAHLVVEADRRRLDATPPGGGWSPRTILAHLRDDEMLCMRPALACLLAETEPTLRLIDGGDWEPSRNRTRDRKETLLADFALQRQATVNMLHWLRPEDWARTGRTAEGRPVTVAGFVADWARHDAEHVAQLEAALGETFADVLARRARPDA
jgi:hypothetical protein